MNAFIKALLFTTLLLTGTLVAENDLGPLSEAQEKYPHCFEHAAVGETTTPDGVAVYYYNGTAERFFEGEVNESDADLWAEAIGDAKAKLYNFFKDDDPTISVTVEIEAPRLAYRWTDGPYYRVLYVINKENLTVTKTKLQPPVIDPPTPPKPELPPPEQPPVALPEPPKEDVEHPTPVAPQPQKRDPIMPPLNKFNPNRIDPKQMQIKIDPSRFNPPQFQKPEGELSPFNSPKLRR